MSRGVYQSLKARAEDFAYCRGAHAGESCLVVGCGPSLAETDLSILRRFPCLMLNAACRASFVVEEAWHVFSDDIRLAEMRPELERSPWPIVAVPIRWGRRTRNAYAPPVRVLWPRLTPSSRIDHRPLFSTDLSAGVYTVNTVMATALQFACHLGFSRVGLVGCDLRFDPDHPYFDESIRYHGHLFDFRRTRPFLDQAATHFDDLVSCAPNSAANEVLQYISLEHFG